MLIIAVNYTKNINIKSVKPFPKEMALRFL